MNKTVIIVAGGSGARMGQELPKQFLLIQGKPILLHSIDSFSRAYSDIHIILVLPTTYISYTKSILDKQGYNTADFIFAEGGETRFHSVRNGLKCLAHDGLVFVHDAVRCLVSPELIRRCGQEAEKYGTAVPVVPVRDSIRKKMGVDNVSEVVPRDDLFMVQTPQTFLSQDIISAFNRPYSSSFTDEATVVESAGIQIHLVEGEEKNIKITFPEDLAFAEWRMNANK